MTKPHCGPEPAGSDAVGEPPPREAGLCVPLTVWPGLPAPGSEPRSSLPCPGPVTPEGATRVITAFSRPGDLVATAGGSMAVIQAAAAAGRNVIGLAPDSRAGRAALAITGCHGTGCCADAPQPDGEDWPEPGPPYAAFQRVLRPGGILAVIIAGPAASDGRLADLPGQVVASARAAGLVYSQHIILVHAAIRNGQFAPHVALGSAGPPAGCQIHSDLLVFVQPGGPL